MNNHLDFSIIQLTTIREAILTVLDDGWRCSGACVLRHPWKFTSKDVPLSPDDEAFDDAQRLRFCDAVQTYLVKEAQKANVEIIDVKARAF